MIYWAVDHTVLCHCLIVKGLCTMGYFVVGTFYRALDHFVPNPSSYCTGPLTMLYRAAYHVLPDIETFYRAVDYELAVLGRFCIGPLTMW